MSRAALAYRTSHTTTASPGRLVVMLYDGALRFVEEAARAYQAGDGPRGDRAVVRAERIILELMGSLDFRYEPAQGLLEMYRLSFGQLADARRRRDPQTLERVRGWLAELRDAWAQVEQASRTEGAVV